MKRPSALVPVIAGFGVMLILIAAVTAIGVTYVRILSGQLTAIVAERNEKAELATAMRAIHEARYQSLMLAGGLADPFSRDEEIMRFMHMAGEFISAREKFLALPMDEGEAELWHRIRDDVRGVERRSEQVIALLQSNQLDAARQRAKQALLPAQDRMMGHWGRLVAMQRERNQAALAEARTASNHARELTLGLSASAFIVGLIIAVFVVRRSRELERDLFEEKERAQITLQAIGDAVIRFNEHRRVCYLNPAAEQLLGVTSAAAMDQAMEGVLRLTDKEKRQDLTAPLLDETLAGRRSRLSDTAILLSAPGLEQDVEGSCTPIRTSEDRVMGGVLVMRDVTEARELHRKLVWQANHDALTGLMNQHAFKERIAHGLVSKRSAEHPRSLLHIDLDHFKPVNDTAGHAVGDELLRQVALLARSRVRGNDILARMGGDEFGIVLSACPPEKAEKIAQEIREGIGKLFFHWEGQTYRLNASIGLVHIPPRGLSTEECLTAANTACDQAKRQGGAQVVVYRHDQEDTP